jgi:hypothetical protein
MTSTITPSTHRASFAIGDEATARGVVDLLTESFFEGQAAIAAFASPDGRWDITVHFAARRIRPRSAISSASPPAMTSATPLPSTRWKPGIGSTYWVLAPWKGASTTF